MRYQTIAGEFKVITAKLGRCQIAQASRLATAGAVTLICSCGPRDIGLATESAMTAANGNNAPMSKQMRYALNCVANYKGNG